ncbi:MAG: type II secretion system F family protein [Candidatus Peregrinibacteria bacterium]
MPEKTKKKFSWNIELGGIGRKDILFFTRHLAIAIKNGLTLQDGLEMLYDDTSKHSFKKVIGEILENIRSGKSFHEGLEKYPKHFSAIYINLIKTGEMAGTLEQNLLHLAEELRKAEELRQKIKSAMMYPMLIFVAVIGLGLSVALFILPKILPLFKSLDVKLPLTTRGLIFVADIFAEHGIKVSIGIIVFAVLFLWFVKQKFSQPITHRVVLKLPIVSGIIKNIQVEQFARTLGTLLNSGITLDRSLRITADATGNLVYKKAILSFITEVEKGGSMASAMLAYPSLFPKIASRMVGMGERTGSLDTTLTYVSQMLADEIDNTMKNLSTIIEPAMLIFIGLIVAVVAISILGPIYKITGSVRQ